MQYWKIPKEMLSSVTQDLILEQMLYFGMQVFLVYHSRLLLKFLYPKMCCATWSRNSSQILHFAESDSNAKIGKISLWSTLPESLAASLFKHCISVTCSLWSLAQMVYPQNSVRPPLFVSTFFFLRKKLC